MIFKNAPFNPELVDILHRSSSYINNKNEHPQVNTCIDALKININTEPSDGEWEISKENINNDTYEKMKMQIATIQMYKQGINIFS